MSSSKKYPWDIIRKLLNEGKVIEEKWANSVINKINEIFKDPSRYKDTELIENYNEFLKECAVKTKDIDSALQCSNYVPDTLPKKEIPGRKMIGDIVNYIDAAYIIADDIFTNSNFQIAELLEMFKSVTMILNIIQGTKYILEQYRPLDLFSAYYAESTMKESNNQSGRVNIYDFVVKYFHLYRYFYIMDFENKVKQISKNYENSIIQSEKVADLLLSNEMLRKEAAKKTKTNTKKTVAAAAAAAEAAAAQVEEVVEAEEEEEVAALEEEELAALEEERQANRKTYLNSLPNYVPKTDESDWKTYIPAIKSEKGQRYKGSYHKKGVCEINFNTLAETLTGLIRLKKYHHAFLQLEKCIQARKDTYSDPRYTAERLKLGENSLSNIRHKQILNGLQQLLQRIKEIGIDNIDRIEFLGKRFRIGTENIQLYEGGTRKRRRSKQKKTRKFKI